MKASFKMSKHILFRFMKVNPRVQIEKKGHEREREREREREVNVHYYISMLTFFTRTHTHYSCREGGEPPGPHPGEFLFPQNEFTNLNLYRI